MALQLALSPGECGFFGTSCVRDAWLGGSSFAGDARFDGARFAGNGWFDETSFGSDAWSGNATFTARAVCDRARVCGAGSLPRRLGIFDHARVPVACRWLFGRILTLPGDVGWPAIEGFQAGDYAQAGHRVSRN
jgi:hypothetical protein